MGLVAAKCTQCGANIEVDASKEAGVCAHCGTAFITEKVINNYTIHNHNTVNNNIANATINVKKGDGIDDYLRRYRAFVDQDKFGSAMNLIAKINHKFPESGIAQYIAADFSMRVKGFEQWLDEANDSAEMNREVYGEGNEKIATGCLGFLWDNEDTYYDFDKLDAAMDALERKSDDVICAQIKNTKYDCAVTERLLREAVMNLPESKVLGFDDRQVFSDAPLDDYDEKRFRNIKSMWKAFLDEKVNWDNYSRALFCLKKTVKFGDTLLTDEERGTYADFIREINERAEKFEALVLRREKLSKRLDSLSDRVYEENKKRIGKSDAGANAETVATVATAERPKKRKKGLFGFLIIVAVIAAAVILIKRFI